MVDEKLEVEFWCGACALGRFVLITDGKPNCRRKAEFDKLVAPVLISFAQWLLSHVLRV